MTKKRTRDLCENCEGFIFGLLNELRNEAQKMKRGTLVLDAIDDLQVSIEDGNIQAIRQRDEEYQQGNRVGRRASRRKK